MAKITLSKSVKQDRCREENIISHRKKRNDATILEKQNINM